MLTYERFLKYVRYPTMSNEESDSCPSTEKQLKLAMVLYDELKELGLEVRLDEYGYLYAWLDPNVPGAPSIGFIAHLDTSNEASDENIKARVVKYEGEDILLNEEKDIYLRANDYPCLLNYQGEHLIVTDGTTLLGADDKAGIAEIMSGVKKIIDTGAPHGRICIAFTPDEEIGRGADRFDVKLFGADYAYTIDGGALGELEYENFNAASAKVKVNGVSIHPGSAMGRMKNASLIAMEFNSLLPTCEIPELTEGYEGFHHLLSMSGECELATLTYIIRDHDMTLFERKKEDFLRATNQLNEKYGTGTIELTIKDSYFNMKEIIEGCMYTVDRVREAMLDEGVEPIVVPIRGGTDGSKLSFMGLPCPNICTGGENFHSRFEFVSVEAMEKISDIIVRIITNATRL